MRYIVMSLLMGILLHLSVASQAQLREAHEAYDMYEFEEAAKLYKRVVDRNMDGKGVAMERLGDCYRFLGDMPEAESWYAKALVENPNVANRTYFNYALVLRDVGKYTEAKDYFLKYASYVPSDTKGNLYAGYMDQILEWKKEKKPIEVRNLLQLNTEYDDYYTVFSSEGYIFASDRPSDGKSKKKAKPGPTKLWVSQGQVNGNWIDLDFPKLFIEPTKKNAKEELGAASFTKDMSRMYFSRQYETQNSFGDIVIGIEIVYRDKQPNGEWGDPQLFPFNSKEYSTAQPSISPDGKSLYFVSDMAGGYGATDIYVSKVTNGQFERPRNLGATVNTTEVEKYPVAVDDTTLYFSSNGHITYGGLDILKSTYRDGAWQKPINLKEPINSKSDDYAFMPIKGEELAIFSSERPGGKGGVDLYVVTPEERPLYIAGKVLNAENKTISNVNINLQNAKDEADKKETTTQKNGDYVFVVKGGEQYMLTFAQQGLSTEQITVNAKTDDAVFDTIKAPNVVMQIAAVEPVEQLVAEETPAAVVEPTPVVEPEPTPEPTPEPEPVAVVETPAPVVEPEPVVEPAPEPTPEPQPEPVVEIRKFNDILYADNSVSPAEQSSSNLRDLTEYLKANPSLLVELNARGGIEGDAEVNLDLAKRRAVNLTDYLKGQGVTASRIFVNPIRLATPENQHSVGVECVRERTTTETASTTVASAQKTTSTSTSKGLRFDNVIFNYNSIYPSKKSYANIGNLIVFMRNNPGYVLELSAYSDARGGANAAMKVSQQRANNLVDYLVKNGVAKNRIEVSVHGATQPLNRCAIGVECSENEHAINRRIELVVRKK